MKLDQEKTSPTGYFRIEHDKISDNYLLETDDAIGILHLHKNSICGLVHKPDKLYELYTECEKKNNRSSLFYFSNWERENTEEQNKLMCGILWIKKV